MAQPTSAFHRKPVVIASAVVLLHVGGLAALQSGLLVRAYELVVPVEMISQIIEPPKPIVPAPPPPPPPPTPSPAPTPAPPEPARNKAVTPPPAQQPLAIADTTPAPNAPVVAAAAPVALSPITTPVSPTPAPTPVTFAPPAAKAESVVEPIIDAGHQADPSRFTRSRISEQFGEWGTVTLNVTVGTDGTVRNVSVLKSSGYPRLDQTAMRGARATRFKPATRGGIPIERNYPWNIVYEEIK